jgi:hypothetical protein
VQSPKWKLLRARKFNLLGMQAKWRVERVFSTRHPDAGGASRYQRAEVPERSLVAARETG